jgi:hypothetical protein
MEYKNIMKCIRSIAEKYDVGIDEFILIEFSDYQNCEYSIKRTLDTDDCRVLYRKIIQKDIGGAVLFIDYDKQKKIHFMDAKNEIMYLPDTNTTEFNDFFETREIDFKQIREEYLKLASGKIIPENKIAKFH